MKKTDELLQFKAGKKTVEENLRRALESGRLKQTEDGHYYLPQEAEGVSPWIHVSKGPSLDCEFKMSFLFEYAYDKSVVPLGCKNCYKVSVTPKSLSQLMALKSVQEKMGRKAKCGVEVDRETTQNIYSGFYYCQGIDEARLVYHEARKVIDENPKLGSDVVMHIKRGCTEYELHCGPSDKFQFSSDLEDLELHLSSKFNRMQKSTKNSFQSRLSSLARWIQTAFRIGDNTYLEFTDEKRLYPKTVRYEP